MKINYKSMSKLTSFTLSILTILFINQISCGQSKPPGESFPTYRQIGPVKAEIVDYVNPGGAMTIRSNAKINLFDYPKNTVTYLLNGKVTMDVDYVRRILLDKGTQIEAVSVGKSDENGKRIIVITYETR